LGSTPITSFPLSSFPPLIHYCIVSLLRGNSEVCYSIDEVKGLVKVNDFEVLEGLYYHKEHLWARIEDGKARIGMTDFALKKLREIVWVELPNVGDNITQNESFGTMESVKATQDLVAPISGTIEKVNEKLKSKPGLLNEDPYGKGWILVATPTNLETELKKIMDFEAAIEWHKGLVKES